MSAAAAAQPQSLVLNSPVFGGVRSPKANGAVKMEIDEAGPAADDLMQPLGDADVARQPAKIPRATAEYDNSSSSRFVQTEVVDRTENYGNTYMVRLKTLAPQLRAAAADKWAGGVEEGLPLVEQLSAVKKDTDSVIVGTVYQEMRLKPDILEEQAKERIVSVKKTISTYRSEDGEDEVVYLEDESGRLPMKEVSELGLKHVCTGTSVAVRCKLSKGSLHVVGFCTAGLAPQRPLPTLPADKYVVLASDLQLGREGLSPLPAQLFADYVCGLLGGSQEQQFAASIARVVLAGNTTPRPDADALATHAALDRSQQQQQSGSVRLLDRFAVQLCGSVDLDVMPGKTDAVNVLQPQQAFHSCLVPQASELSSFHRVTNPYECTLDGVVLLGSDGQNLDERRKYTHPSADTSSLDALEEMLTTCHMMSSAPDTIRAQPYRTPALCAMSQALTRWVGCVAGAESYPFPDRDPFVLEATPYVAPCTARPRLRLRSG